MKIIVDNLCRSFGNIRALDGVSFEIPDGAVCGFVGTNGAGKTTALRIMAGLDTPDCGSVFFDQLSATDYPEQIPAIAGFMPDTLVNAHNIRVREYLDFFAAGKKRLHSTASANTQCSMNCSTARFPHSPKA